MTTTTNGNKGGARTIALLLAGMMAGGAAVYGVLRPREHAHGEAQAEALQPAAPQPKWHCPMHPTYVSDRPGDCPICGMKLVPMEAAKPRESDPAEGLAEVEVDAQRQQLIGLRTAPVTVGPIGSGWRTVGRVAVDETRVRKVNVKVDGFVERLYADFVGRPVKRGEALLTVYSPQLLSVQSEYLLARETQRKLAAAGGAAGGAGEELVASARRRLELWDVTPAEIDELEATGKPRRTLTLHSPISGVITAKSVVQGSRLSAGDTPFEITDLSQVWVLADAYESDFPRLKLGLRAEFHIEGLPGRRFRGAVSFIEPVIDPKTRTARMRLSFANPGGALRPDMYGEVALQAKAKDVLRVPFDAVIDSGEQKVVFVSLGEGRFQPRLVQTGAVSSDYVEVTSGLEEDEEVVTRANFLIDSESRLKAALAALANKPADAGHAGHKP